MKSIVESSGDAIIGGIMLAEEELALSLSESEIAVVNQLPEMYPGVTAGEILGYVAEGDSVGFVAECLRIRDEHGFLQEEEISGVFRIVKEINFTFVDETNLGGDAGKFFVGGHQVDAHEYEQKIMEEIGRFLIIKTDDNRLPLTPSGFYSPIDGIIETLLEPVMKVEREGKTPLQYLAEKMSALGIDILMAYHLCQESENDFLLLLCGKEYIPYHCNNEAETFFEDILMSLGSKGYTPCDFGIIMEVEDLDRSDENY